MATGSYIWAFPAKKKLCLHCFYVIIKQMQTNYNGGHRIRYNRKQYSGKDV